MLLAIPAVTYIFISYAIFLQLFIAVACAYILNPAVRALEQKGISRVAGILIVFAGTLLICGSFVFFLAVSLGNEFSNIQLNLPSYIQHIYSITPSLLKGCFGIETPEKLAQVMNGMIQNARDAIPGMVRPVLQFLRSIFSMTIGAILTFLGYLIVPVYLFYLLLDFNKLADFIKSFVPERFLPSYGEKLDEIDAVLSGFVRGQMLVCTILAVLYSIGLYVIGVDLAIAIGTLAGATFIIPYLGTALGILLSVVMAALKYNDLLHPLLCAGWFSVVQLLEGTVITPKVVGNTVGLHPLVAIVALLLGGQLFGIVGMLLAVPFTAVLQVFLRSAATEYRNSEFYRNS